MTKSMIHSFFIAHHNILDTKEPNILTNTFYNFKNSFNNWNILKYFQHNNYNNLDLKHNKNFINDSYQQINCAKEYYSKDDSLKKYIYKNLTNIESIEYFLSSASVYEINCISFSNSFNYNSDLLLQSIIKGNNQVSNYLLKNLEISLLINKDNEKNFSYLLKNKNIFAINQLLKNHKIDSQNFIKNSISLLKNNNAFDSQEKKNMLENFLFESIKFNQSNFSNYLLNNNITTSLTDKDGKGTLYYAIKNKNLSIVEKILEDNTQDTDIRQALILLSNQAHYETNIVKNILSSNILFDNFKKEIFTLMIRAVKEGDLENINQIISKNLFITDELNKFIVIASGNQKDNSPEIIKSLLKAGGQCHGILETVNASKNYKIINEIKNICKDELESQCFYNKSHYTSVYNSKAFLYLDSIKSSSREFVCNYTKLFFYAPIFSLLITTQKEAAGQFVAKPQQGTLKSFSLNFFLSYSKFILIVPLTDYIQNYIISNLCKDKDLDEEIMSLKSFNEALIFQNEHDSNYYLSSDNCRGKDLVKNKFEHLDSNWTLCEINLAGEYNQCGYN